MIIKGEHVRIFREDGRKLPINKKTIKSKIEYQCDKCGKICVDIDLVFNKRIKLINKEYCGKCSRPLMSSLAGLKSNYDECGNLKPNRSRFTSEKVKSLTSEEYKKYCKQRQKIALNFHKTLNKNPKLKQEHYEKIYKKSTIGYISKGQMEVFNYLKPYGFELEKVISGIRCDIIHEKRKIVVEFYGDFWHANPRIYKPDDFIPVINMTSKEKWNKDRRRNFYLRNLGYTIIIIWQKEWENDRNNSFKKLKELKDENFIFPIWNKKETKRKWMCNNSLNIQKTILNKDVKKYLEDGWIMGHLNRRIKENEINTNSKNTTKRK